MKKEWDIIEVLRHSRHDWLNRMQLIKGNLDLGKTERARAIIEEIVIETQQESKLSNLKTPGFASLLLKANWESHYFRLEYEVLSEMETHAVNDIVLTGWTASFFSVLDTSIEAFQENHLTISIDSGSDGIRFFFEFSGIITGTTQLKQFLTTSMPIDMQMDVKEFSERELALEVLMPFID